MSFEDLCHVGGMIDGKMLERLGLYLEIEKSEGAAPVSPER